MRKLFEQLGFDFSEKPAESPQTAPQLFQPASVPRPIVEKPARGKAALRARTAVMFSRLQDLGLHNVDRLVLMRTRTVMVSMMGRNLRVNEGYADAPESVLRAIVVFATARNRKTRNIARDVILSYEIQRAPAPRRPERARPGDVGLLTQLAAAHKELNATWFGSTLTDIPIRLSVKMSTRHGHYDPVSRHVRPEIVMSRRHVVKDGWREATHTLLHEMVHQWQHETGLPIDHGREFRKKAKEVGIVAAARRDLRPLEKLRGYSAQGIR
jgi:hypothetical protein